MRSTVAYQLFDSPQGNATIAERFPLPRNHKTQGGTIGCTKVRDGVLAYPQIYRANLVIRVVRWTKHENTIRHF